MEERRKTILENLSNGANPPIVSIQKWIYEEKIISPKEVIQRMDLPVENGNGMGSSKEYVSVVQKWITDKLITPLEIFKDSKDGSELKRWIKPIIVKLEKEKWEEVEKEADVWKKLKLLLEYVDVYSMFSEIETHIVAAEEMKQKLEETLWNQIMVDVKDKSITADDVVSELKLYKDRFPESSHKQECDAWIEDEPWIKTIKKHNIDDYKDYIDTFHKHIKEAEDAIEDIQDDIDWKNAEENDQNVKSREEAIMAYENYLQKHSKEKNVNLVKDGKYVSRAKERIRQLKKKPVGPLTPEQRLFEELKKDRNKYNPKEIQEKVKDHITEWDHLVDEGIFDEDECQAIKDYKKPYELDFPAAPEKLSDETTEVYFWGTRGTGKTCAMGAVLSAANTIEGNLTTRPCSGKHYADALSNMLKAGTIALLPNSNPTDPSVSEMLCSFRKEIEKKTLLGKTRKINEEHGVSIVDVAGEVFVSMYLKSTGKQLKEIDEKLLNIIEKFLKTGKKDKIHFFVIEYGDGAGAKEVRTDRIVPPPTQDQTLSNGLQYLSDNHILGNSVSINVLVTKCDLMSIPENQTRKSAVAEYVKKEYKSFWKQLTAACEDNNIHNHYNSKSFEPEIIPFSIGEVFTRSLCRFDDADTKKVMDVFLEKTYGISKDTFWSRLLNFLRG